MFYSGFVVGFVVVVVLVVTWPHAEVVVILTCLVAPCPRRMDSYLCEQNEIKSPFTYYQYVPGGWTCQSKC